MCPENDGCGLAFELQKTATGYEEIVILQMQPTRAGEYPTAGLVSDAAGNLYGSTPSGNGIAGTVFKLTLGEFGWAYTVILTGNSDLGGFGPLTIDSAGNLFGPASGSKIFELSPPAP